jgi:subtilisin family serine protease
MKPNAISPWRLGGWLILLAMWIGCEPIYTPPDGCPPKNTAQACPSTQSGYDRFQYILWFDDSVDCERRQQMVLRLQSIGAAPLRQCGCDLYLMGIPPSIDPNEHLTKAYTEMKHNGGGGHLSRNYQFSVQPVSALDTGIQVNTQLPSQFPPRKASDLTVGIIDMGMDFDHNAIRPYFRMNAAANTNCYFGDELSYNSYVYNGTDIYDGNGHGTHIAGIIALESNEAVPRDYDPALKPGLDLLSVKITKGQTMETDLFAGVCGIKYAVERGVDILNLSWGYYAPEYDTLLAQVLTLARDSGVFVVTSAGNDGIDTDVCPHWPSGFSAMADYEHLISVASLDTTGQALACYSNYGEKSVQIAAPGTDVFSTYPLQSCATMTGTSMAAPFVARYAAMLALSRPALSGAALRSQVLSDATTFAGAGMRPPQVRVPISDELVCP